MKYAQVKSGQKLHLVFELANGSVSQPVCGRKVDGYRMTINVPLARACKNCLRVTDRRLIEFRNELVKTVDPSSLVN